MHLLASWLPATLCGVRTFPFENNDVTFDDATIDSTPLTELLGGMS